MLDIGTKVEGKFSLTSPSFIEYPRNYDVDLNRYFYIVSADDNLKRDFLWAIEKMAYILEDEESIRKHADAEIVIKFHLFDACNELSKTPSYAALLITPDQKHVIQYMFTDYTTESIKYTYEDIVDFKNKVLVNIGWENDRE